METKTTVTQGVPVRTGKKRLNQLPAAIVVFLGIIAVAVILGGKSPDLAISWVIGIGFGIVLQKARFCFAAAFRDPFLTGSTSLAKAVIIALAIATLGFAASASGWSLPGDARPGPS